MKELDVKHHIIIISAGLAFVGTTYWLYLERDIKTAIIWLTATTTFFKHVYDYKSDPLSEVEHREQLRAKFYEMVSSKELYRVRG